MTVSGVSPYGLRRDSLLILLCSGHGGPIRSVNKSLPVRGPWRRVLRSRDLVGPANAFSSTDSLPIRRRAETAGIYRQLAH